MAEQQVNNHCDVGEEWVSTCAVCDRRVCHRHQGNPDALAGGYVGCIDHKVEVDEMNRQWWEKYHATH